MRMIAGAIVMFAGALLCSAAVVAAPLAGGLAHNPELGFGGRLFGYIVGGVLLLIGLLILISGLKSDNPKGQ